MRLSDIVGDESIRKLVVDCKNAGFEISKPRIAGSIGHYTDWKNNICQFTRESSGISGRYIFTTEQGNKYNGVPMAKFSVEVYENRYEVQFYIGDNISWWSDAETIINMKPGRHGSNSYFDGIDDDDEIRLAVEKIKMIAVMNIGLLSPSNPSYGGDYQSGPTHFVIKK